MLLRASYRQVSNKRNLVLPDQTINLYFLSNPRSYLTVSISIRLRYEAPLRRVAVLSLLSMPVAVFKCKEMKLEVGSRGGVMMNALMIIS